MAAVRIALALDRIDQAARRIEAAAARSVAPTDPDLEARYRALRAQTETALAELDSLIGSLAT